MPSIEDPDVVNQFREAMQETQSKMQVLTAALTEVALEQSRAYKQLISSAVDTCSKKCKNDDPLFETIQMYEKYRAQKRVLVKEKREAISQSLGELEQKQSQVDELRLKMQKLREEQAGRRDLVVSQNQTNMDRLYNLQKAKQVFQEHLGLEIRKTHGEKLQFIFQNVDPASPDNVYTFMLGIQPDRSYQIISSDPPLKSLKALEKRLCETNNLSAFLANMRKEFVVHARF